MCRDSLQKTSHCTEVTYMDLYDLQVGQSLDNYHHIPTNQTSIRGQESTNLVVSLKISVFVLVYIPNTTAPPFKGGGPVSASCVMETQF
jgi:hypothetical protein